MTISDKVSGAVAKKLMKTSAMYRYKDVITKPFLETVGRQIQKLDKVFTKEPIGRVVVALCVGIDFVGTNGANPFQYQKSGL